MPPQVGTDAREGIKTAWHVLRVGALVGALAGLWTAMGDYGAMWLWLPLWRDRIGLFARLLAMLIPVGALLGGLLGLLGALAWRAATWRPTQAPQLFPLPFVLLSLPSLRLLAVKLCSGGMMSRLSYRAAIEWTLTLVLPLLLYATLALGARCAQALPKRPQVAIGIGSALLLIAALLGKINQTVLPNLYEYLHTALALCTWGSAALGLVLLRELRHLVTWRAKLESPRSAGLWSTALVGMFVANALTLNANLNVRVAMFDARSPASRSLLASSDPILRWVEGRNGDRRGGGRVLRGATDTTGLPTHSGAHIVLITIDALRADHLGTYGYRRPVSPHLDALAKQAVVFERAYAQAPHSSYSLCSLHTSEYVHEVVELGRPLPTQTLAGTLKQHGYHTAAFFTDGIFHTEGTKLTPYREQAFDFDLFDHTNRESEQQTDRVLQEVDRIKGLGEPPSFLWVHYFDVHEPYQETTFGSGEMDRYDSEIAHVDRELSRLLVELEKRFDREVVLAITADHGEEFRDHGGVYHGSTLYDEQVRVPLIVRAAGLTPLRVAPPVEVIDIAPTLLGLAALPVPGTMRGRDLRAAALGRMPDPGPVFSAVLTKRMAVRWPLKLIADLRFGLFELYDLSTDPEERKNLASLEPQKLGEMRDLVYAWLDSIERQPGAAQAAGQDDLYSRALRWGRLGDRRAVEPTCKLLLDTSAPTDMRVEAGQILAKLADESSAPTLVSGLQTSPPEVAAEAAIALGRMYDDRARAALQRLVHVEDPHVRARAAVSLGRLRDRAAVPALIDALWVAPTQYEREEAVRWLGRLGDRRAVEPLLGMLTEFNLRYLIAVALGQLGDPRSYDTLADMLGWERHTNIRDEVVRGLGLLGDPRGADLLLGVLAHEANLKNTAESLIRLHALERGMLGGVDISPATKGASGLGPCEAGPLVHDWDYLARTFCTSTGSRVELQLPLPGSADRWSTGAQLVIRGRRSDAAEPVDLHLSLGNGPPTTARVDGAWSEQRVALEPSQVKGSTLRLTFVADQPEARISLDHVLVVPRTLGPLAFDSDAPKPTDDAKRIP